VCVVLQGFLKKMFEVILFCSFHQLKQKYKNNKLKYNTTILIIHTAKIGFSIGNRNKEPLLLNKKKRGKETEWHNI
jgi:hypothetical protein